MMTATDWMLLMCYGIGLLTGVWLAYLRWGQRARLAEANRHIMALGCASTVERATGEARKALQLWQATRYDVADDGSCRVPLPASMAMAHALGALEAVADSKTPNVNSTAKPAA